MKLQQITNYQVKSLTDQELLNAHLKCHQLYINSIKHTNHPLRMIALQKHTIIANDLIRRDIDHDSPLGKENIKMLHEGSITDAILDTVKKADLRVATEVERYLNCKLPISYRNFLNKGGENIFINVFSHEVGIYKPHIHKHLAENVIYETLDARAVFDLDNNYVKIHDVGNGDIDCIECSTGKIVSVLLGSDKGNRIKPFKNNFKIFLKFLADNMDRKTKAIAVKFINMV
jgi:hypothetical protein